MKDNLIPKEVEQRLREDVAIRAKYSDRPTTIMEALMHNRNVTHDGLGIIPDSDLYVGRLLKERNYDKAVELAILQIIMDELQKQYGG